MNIPIVPGNAKITIAGQDVSDYVTNMTIGDDRGDIGQDAAMHAAQMNDGPDAWCAACGQHWAPRSRRGIEDGRGGRFLLMLCDDTAACVATFRATGARR